MKLSDRLIKILIKPMLGHNDTALRVNYEIELLSTHEFRGSHWVCLGFVFSYPFLKGVQLCSLIQRQPGRCRHCSFIMFDRKVANLKR